MSGSVRIGISGWTYQGWRDVFYPGTLPRRRELEYASRRLDTIEINGSFYSLQTPDSYRRWYAETPAGFAFALKGSRFITHMKKLRDPLVHRRRARSLGGSHPRVADGARPRGCRGHSRLRARAPRRADVYVYFDNDAKVEAPFDALRLAARLGLGPQAATSGRTDGESQDRRAAEDDGAQPE